MPPQNPNQPVAEPQPTTNPNPQTPAPDNLPREEIIEEIIPKSDPKRFDFMLKDRPKPKRSLGLPSGIAGKILVIGVAIVVIILAASLIFGGKKSNTTQVLDLMAQQQEMIRVSKLEDRQFTDANVLNLSATTQETLQSQQAQLKLYLSKIKAKYKLKQLAARTNQSTDAQLQTAYQNNNLEKAYVLYLKNALATYQSSIQELYKTTPSKTLKLSLNEAYSSVAVLLKSPQFSS